MSIQTFTLGTKTLKIELDSSCESPREWCNLGTFISTDENGDKTDFSFSGEYNSRQDFIDKGENEIRKHFKDVAIILPVHKYIHSGVGYSTSYSYPYNCRWDSGTVGFIFVTKKEIRENWNIKRVTKEKLKASENILSSEIEIFSKWANGEVYGYILEEDDEEIDSCFGFIGYDLETNGILDHIDSEWEEIVKELV